MGNLIIPVILALLLHAILLVQATFIIGTPKCSRVPFALNRRRILEVIQTIPETGRGEPVPGDRGLMDTPHFMYIMPPGGPYHLPAIFESANGDAQVYVFIDNQAGLDLHDPEVLTLFVWPYVRHMAFNIYTKCRTARFGQIGYSILEYTRGAASMTIRVGFSRKYPPLAQGHNIFFYSARGGPGPPVFVHQ